MVTSYLVRRIGIDDIGSSKMSTNPARVCGSSVRVEALTFALFQYHWAEPESRLFGTLSATETIETRIPSQLLVLCEIYLHSRVIPCIIYEK